MRKLYSNKIMSVWMQLQPNEGWSVVIHGYSALFLHSALVIPTGNFTVTYNINPEAALGEHTGNDFPMCRLFVDQAPQLLFWRPVSRALLLWVSGRIRTVYPAISAATGKKVNLNNFVHRLFPWMTAFTFYFYVIIHVLSTLS